MNGLQFDHLKQIIEVALQCGRFVIFFKEEAFYGDVIISQSEQTEEEDGQQLFTHRIIRESDGVELFLARTRWNSEI